MAEPSWEGLGDTQQCPSPAWHLEASCQPGSPDFGLSATKLILRQERLVNSYTCSKETHPLSASFQEGFKDLRNGKKLYRIKDGNPMVVSD